MDGDLDRAWARFRDEFEAERTRIAGLIETAGAALQASDAPLGSIRETLLAAGAELQHMDTALANMHTQMMAVRQLLEAIGATMN
jgi:hypothetical protein